MNVTVNVDQGWRAADSAEDYFVLIRGSGDNSTGGLTVNTFGGTTYGDPCVGPGTESKGGSQSVQTFFDYLASIDALSVTNVQPVTVAGLDGKSADIVANNGCSGRIWLWQTPITGDFHFVAGEAAKIWAVDLSGTTVVITAEGFSGPADLNQMLPSVEGIVASMTIS